MPEERSFLDSLALCRLFNSTVATPFGPEENALLTKNLQPFRGVCDPTKSWKLWLGISDKEVEDVWRDVSTNQVLEYRNFVSTYPIGGVQYNCALLTVEGLWQDADCKLTNKKCSACTVHKGNLLRLRGLCFDSEYQTRFRLEGYVDGRPILYGYYDLIVHFNAHDEVWVLSNAFKNSTLLRLPKIGRFSYPVGRHDWTADVDVCERPPGSSLTLSISSCSNDQYMCNSGQCISLAKRCNLYHDCHDKTDELDCLKVEVGDEYQKELPPTAPGNTILELKPKFKLIRIANVEDINMVVTLEFKITFTWKDDRVSLKHLHTQKGGSILTGAEMQKLWTPKYQFTNLARGEKSLLEENLFIDSANNPQKPLHNDVDMGKSTFHAEERQCLGTVLCIEGKFWPKLMCNFRFHQTRFHMFLDSLISRNYSE